MGSRVSKLSKLSKHPKSSYILGLWCADGYHRSSSIGLTNTNPELIKHFAGFLLESFSQDRLRLRVYYPAHFSQEPSVKAVSSLTDRIVFYPMAKCQKVAYQLYVNSRSLLREFRLAREQRGRLETKLIPPYLAGRFDGDGSVSRNVLHDFRIVYGQKGEAEVDRRLIRRLGIRKIRVYRYRTAGTYVLYVSRHETKSIVSLLASYSVKLQTLLPRRD